MTSHTTHQISPEIQKFIKNCLDCHSICLETITYCLQKSGRHAEANHIKLLLDCVEICQTSANFMARGSDLHMHVCAVCAEICEKCAESCAQFGDDERLRACAEACRRCAKSCHQMEVPTKKMSAK